MTALELMRTASNAVLLLVAALTLMDFLRRPGRTRLEINLMFGSIANAILVQEFVRLTSIRPAWLLLFAVLSILAQPYLLLVLVRQFMAVPRLIQGVALVGMLASWVAMLMLPADAPVPLPSLILVCAYFATVEGYATLAFARGALALKGVSGRRMSLAAAGSGLLTAAILIAVVRSVAPAATAVVEIVSSVLALLMGLCYYAGFVPPGPLRRAWQLQELHRFLTDVSRSPVERRAAEAAQRLCLAASRVAGGVGSFVSRWERHREALVVVASDREDVVPLGSVIPTTGVAAGRAWREQRPVAVASVSGLGSVGRQRAAALQAQALLTVPIATGHGLWGLLGTYLARPSLFPDEDLEMVQLLVEEYARVLEHGELLEQQRALMERLEANNQELEEASSSKSKFLASMSHELRTPLSAIIGFSELLLNEEQWKVDEAARAQYLNHIHESGVHLLGLINDILDLSKVEAGRMELQLAPFSVPEAVAEAVETVRPLATKKDIGLTAPADGAGEVVADEGKFKQVMLNLLSNAIKFTPEGGRVWVEVAQDDCEARVAVIDTGVGISPEDQERVFGEFEQVATTAGPRPPGTGLGLALTRRLVELGGGRIWVESTPGEGSRFTFTLPLGPPASSAQSPTAGPEEDRQAPPYPSANGQRPLVLVVDDDIAAASLLKAYLTEAGYAVEVARDGDEALRKARAHRPLAVTLDLLMPGIDGWEMLRLLKDDPQLSDIPTVVVSVVSEREVGLALGAVDYFVKPVDRAALLRSVQRFALASKVRGGSIRVLVVEDDLGTQGLVRTILEGEGFEVLGTAAGAEALALARAHHPDLVLLDLELPDIDGVTVAARLKAGRTTRDIPILVLTGRDLDAEEKRRLNRYALSIVEKGVSPGASLAAWLQSVQRDASGG